MIREIEQPEKGANDLAIDDEKRVEILYGSQEATRPPTCSPSAQGLLGNAL